MSVPTTSPQSSPAPAPTSVFVDESGRRRARTRVVARTLVGAAGIYVLVVIAGLTSAVSLPGVHLGVLAQVAPGREHANRLGERSKVLSLPAALKGARRAAGARSPGDASPGRSTAPGAHGPGGSNAGTETTGSTPSSNGATTTTKPSSVTTTSLPVTTTTRHHGQPTSTSHGPPSTKPGVGKGRTAP
jgi:hypothetical protein